MSRHLLALGFEFDERRGGGHLNFFHPDHGRFILASSPSDPRWRQNTMARLARVLGISRRELEMKFGIGQEKHQGPKRQRKRNHAGVQHRKIWGEAAREDPVPPEPPQPSTLGEIAEEIQRATHAVNTAIPDSPAYRSALAEVARLRGAYMQLEQDAA